MLPHPLRRRCLCQMPVQFITRDGWHASIQSHIRAGAITTTITAATENKWHISYVIRVWFLHPFLISNKLLLIKFFSIFPFWFVINGRQHCGFPLTKRLLTAFNGFSRTATVVATVAILAICAFDYRYGVLCVLCVPTSVFVLIPKWCESNGKFLSFHSSQM